MAAAMAGNDYCYDGGTDEGGTPEGEFYDVRDDMAGGTDNMWTAAANWDSLPHIDGPVTTFDTSPTSFSGVLSQSELTS